MDEYRQIEFKTRFSTFPIGAKRKNTVGIEFHEVGFIPLFWVGFPKQRKKPNWRISSNWVENAFFDFPHRSETKKHPWERIARGRSHTTIFGVFFQAAQKAELTNFVKLSWKRVFRLSPSERNEKTPLGANCTRSVSYHYFGWAFPSSAKSRIDEYRQNWVPNAFFDFPHRGETKKHPWDRNPRGRFHTTILGGLFQAAQKAELTNIVKLSSKRVFRLSPSGRNEKTPLGSQSTRSVSYHYFGWAFPSSAKSRIDQYRQNWVPNAFLDFPHRGETKKHPWNRNPRGWFDTTILGGLFLAAQKAELTNIFKLSSKRVFRLSPSGRNEKTLLGSQSTRSVSYHYFGWAFPSSAKSRINEYRQIEFKTRFSTFPIGAKRKNTLGIEFHESGLIPPFWVGFSKQRKKPNWRISSKFSSKRVFRLSPSGRNEITP